MSPEQVRRKLARAEGLCTLRTARQSLRWSAHLPDPALFAKSELRQHGNISVVLVDCSEQPGHIARWLYCALRADAVLVACGFAPCRDAALFRAGQGAGRNEQ